ncbi:putative Gamma-soluble NSF attachment protein (SNAP-gamma) (N-ethylmaleimide-sensitive factor attachment protein, gamma) [Trypanosoma grayi]|uniref:putative Gamma-soluble NSF attachment protein (SNAP-gamma) (N-ethylmaleimide-sensitive factor attachment protein, gamma) n=1 Tax=Trypanosoma grayi TaxID=71804 RepID=UPI0004F431ED|nr:putative Gamma-soluble NSF attachment protein (SNAP-gamma) (N-ethylmaleimide-sensitive factor attachment protein, gamma) [Trypanosoma grayi]KEG15645.1 putative Gamma-soluble NSF attachment protein (SNAP-gamma) (N-ethylmaleimide-sensitive factor attachment protein, gamma) [Trypanosoma grayi]
MSSSNSGSNLKEAEALMKSAAKHAEVGLFKWKPNWDGAATDYEKAARIYTHAENSVMATDAWRKASNAHEKAGNSTFAARSMESLALFLGDLAQRRGAGAGGASLLSDAISTYAEASRLYELDGKFDRQAESLKSAALLLGKGTATGGADLQRVCDLLRSAVEVLEERVEEQQVYATRLPDMYHLWMLTHLRGGDVPGAVTVLERKLGFTTGGPRKSLYERLAQPQNAAKAILEVVVLCLSRADPVWARQEVEKLRSVPGFAGSREEATVEVLLSSFEDRDVEQLKEAVKEQTLQFITADISRLAKKLSIKGSEAHAKVEVLPPKQQQQQQEGLDIDPEEDIR